MENSIKKKYINKLITYKNIFLVKSNVCGMLNQSKPIIMMKKLKTAVYLLVLGKYCKRRPVQLMKNTKLKALNRHMFVHYISLG